MAKEYFVLAKEPGAERPEVLYEHGHYDIEGARDTMRQDVRRNPQRSYFIVHIEEQYFAGDFR